jgi:hypothetical protein
VYDLYRPASHSQSSESSAATRPRVLELAMHGYCSAVAPGQKKLGRHTEQLRAAPNKPGTHAQLLSCALPTGAEEFGGHGTTMLCSGQYESSGHATKRISLVNRVGPAVILVICRRGRASFTLITLRAPPCTSTLPASVLGTRIATPTRIPSLSRRRAEPACPAAATLVTITSELEITQLHPALARAANALCKGACCEVRVSGLQAMAISSSTLSVRFVEARSSPTKGTQPPTPRARLTARDLAGHSSQALTPDAASSDRKACEPQSSQAVAPRASEKDPDAQSAHEPPRSTCASDAST